MFNLFRKKPPQKTAERRPRGVLPTYVTEDAVVLCKASLAIRNAYDIRLALYMASTRKLKFILTVPPGAKVEPALKAHLEKHGGSIEEKNLSDFCVFVGHIKRSGEEGDGWVLGDATALSRFHDSLHSDWCKQNLIVGKTLTGSSLDKLQTELMAETVSLKNIDDENIRDALLALARTALIEGGIIFLQ